MMKKYIFYLLTAALVISAVGCSEDELPKGVSNFDPTEQELQGFDKWLDINYRAMYNIDLKYKMEDIENQYEYNVSPVEFDKAVQTAKLLKFLWLDVFVEEVDIHFMRAYAPKVVYLIGTNAYKDDGTVQNGFAEGGIKISLFNLNQLDLEDIRYFALQYIRLTHHEFMHILHQTKDMPKEFELITPNDYRPSGWANRSTEQARKEGFVSNYAGYLPQEDFVETIAYWSATPADVWDRILEQAGEEGSAKILQKLEVCRQYLRVSWGIDLDRLRANMHRRYEEVLTLDLDNF